MSKEGRRIRNLLGLGTRPKPAVGTTAADVVHAENKWRLLRYRQRAEGPAFDTPILLVPSLINRHYVLDLAPGRSFVEFLVARGHDVFIIDWGTPTPEDRYVTFDDVCDRIIARALRCSARCAGVDQVHLLGYCLGGTLAAIHAAARPQRVATLTALAAPISFSDDGLLARWVRTKSFDVDTLVEAMGLVPSWLMQGAFQMLRPTLGLQKAVRVVDKAWDDEFLDGFFALERWSNDNVAFPGAAYVTYIHQLYRGDALIHDRFALSGRPARLRSIRMPTLAVTFADDHIVPQASASCLIERISSADKTELCLRGGHVGAVVSRRASTTLWPQLSAWWAARDTPSHAAAPTAEPVVTPLRTAAR